MLFRTIAGQNSGLECLSTKHLIDGSQEIVEMSVPPMGRDGLTRMDTGQALLRAIEDQFVTG